MQNCQLTWNLKRLLPMICFPTRSELSITPEWTFGVYTMQFFQLPPNYELPLPPKKNYVKIITGGLTALPTFAHPKTVRDLLVTAPTIRAASEGAVICLFGCASTPPVGAVTSLHQALISGPMMEVLQWKKCETISSNFAGMEFYNLKGFVLADENRMEICFIQFWAAGRGIDCGLHDHSDVKGDAAFCETHLCLYNGTSEGGMVSRDSND